MSQPVALSSSLNPASVRGMGYDEMSALFLLAGFRIDDVQKLYNNYWPDVPTYAELRENSPWWLVNTVEMGRIVIGWRKRVISISWGEASYRGIITADDVTKDATMVHAWGYPKALEYLVALKSAALSRVNRRGE